MASFPAKERWKWKQNIIILILDDEIETQNRGGAAPQDDRRQSGESGRLEADLWSQDPAKIKRGGGLGGGLHGSSQFQTRGVIVTLDGRSFPKGILR